MSIYVKNYVLIFTPMFKRVSSWSSQIWKQITLSISYNNSTIPQVSVYWWGESKMLKTSVIFWLKYGYWTYNLVIQKVSPEICASL